MDHLFYALLFDDKVRRVLRAAATPRTLTPNGDGIIPLAPLSLFLFDSARLYL